MKKYIFLIMLSVALASCDDTFDSIKAFNTAPTIYFNGVKNQPVVEGKVKTSLKHGSGKFEFYINAEDAERQNLSVSYKFSSGDGKIFLGNSEQNGSFGLEGGEAAVTFQAVNIGNVVIDFTVTDAYGAAAVGTVKLTVFVNQPPLATFTWSNKKLDGPYYIEFDATASKDQDQDVGGGIQMYRYTIKKNGTEGSEVINTDKPVLPYNLRGPGGYDVTLEVFDNDGAKSDPFKPTTANQVTVN